MCLCLGIYLLGAAEIPISKPTPLYGQPSWWGEDEDPANKKQSGDGKSPERESPGQKTCLIFSVLCEQATDLILVFIQWIHVCVCVYISNVCNVICAVTADDIYTFLY